MQNYMAFACYLIQRPVNGYGFATRANRMEPEWNVYENG